MTNRRTVEQRLDSLEKSGDGTADADGEIYVVAIGGDPDLPSGWLTREEYEKHYADSRDDPSEFEWHYKPTGKP